jgi:hypothetical protein
MYLHRTLVIPARKHPLPWSESFGMRLIVFLTGIGCDGYLMPSKKNDRTWGVPLTSEVCYLMQLCEVSFMHLL